jgi:hypothetical protein
MTEVIEWLESEQGELWSKERHDRLYELVTVKDDIDTILYETAAWVWHA